MRAPYPGGSGGQGMPPEIRELMQQREKLMDAMEGEEIAARENVLKFAWLICACRPWPDPHDRSPAQAGCDVHGTVMITRAGRVL